MSSSHGPDEDFSEGFHGLPSEKERGAMSVLQLAELLVPLQKDTVPYIVLSHELNLKIAKCQVKATLNAGWLGVGGAIISAFISFALGYFIGTSQPKEPNESHPTSAITNTASQPTEAIANPVLSTPAAQVALPKSLEGPSVDNHVKKKNQSSNTKP